MRPVKFNCGLPSGDYLAMTAMARRAEELGFYSVSIDDHFFMRGLMSEPTSPHLECYSALAAVAAITKTVRLVPMVTSMSYRNPALLAKMIATLDNISGGRFIAGLGAGWFKEEYIAYNYPYPSNAERIEQFADGIKVLKSMWTEDEPSYHGRFHSVEKAYCFPRPVQKPYPPIMVGGGGKKILKIAAEEADILNLNPPITKGMVDIADAMKFDHAEVLRRIGILDGYAREAGRSPDAIEMSGQTFVLIAKEKSVADAMIKATAQAMGIADPETARKSPQVLVGTIDEIKRELDFRIEKFRMTYFVCQFVAPEAMDLFAKEVMPKYRR
ncbi:MAG: LLM class flavin-dependent oxidoreductase [Candidatus Binataceae bacterium]